MPDAPGYDKPLSWLSLAATGILDAVTPISGEHCPGGSWQQTWRLWAAGTTAGHHLGYLQLERETTASDCFVLKASMSLLAFGRQAEHQTSARMECIDNALSTPRAWTMKSSIIDLAAGKPFSDGAMSLEACVEENILRINYGSGRCRVRTMPAAWTADWPLFDALGRLPCLPDAPLTFDLLEELDKLKTGHRLAGRAPATIRYGGGDAAVRCFEHYGVGRLPAFYYVDGSGRLLLAIRGIQAWILDAGALGHHRCVTEQLAEGKAR